ncbi:hypothetical protein PAXRUDRAFT_826449 [Paxillus rubicundulus Ve08.2h10]|uniref:Uncharacterized protein n=1 Tax=Paxillus rubicundulus Ve08.2h10 TaxID=930991 RepID=A0A0D0DZJ8_9AGAM|nr:hypothetical protein PAXRUDRAFT_826449 [Paxillus rubicundulus Ve08.2h10]
MKLPVVLDSTVAPLSRLDDQVTTAVNVDGTLRQVLRYVDHHDDPVFSLSLTQSRRKRSQTANEPGHLGLLKVITLSSAVPRTR